MRRVTSTPESAQTKWRESERTQAPSRRCPHLPHPSPFCDRKASPGLPLAKLSKEYLLNSAAMHGKTRPDPRNMENRSVLGRCSDRQRLDEISTAGGTGGGSAASGSR